MLNKFFAFVVIAMPLAAFAQPATCSVVDIDNAGNDSFGGFSALAPQTGKYQKTYAVRQVAPGELVTMLLNGSGLAQPLYAGQTWPTSATLGMTVSVNGQAAPMYEAVPLKSLYLEPALKGADGMVIFQVPFGITGTGVVLGIVGGNCNLTLTVPFGPVAPAFYGLVQDARTGLMNGPSNPLRVEQGYGYVSVYGYGFGEFSQPSVTAGVPAPLVANPLSAGTVVTATVDGQPVDVLYAGVAPGSIGQYQFVIKVPGPDAYMDVSRTLDVSVNGTVVGGFQYWVLYQ